MSSKLKYDQDTIASHLKNYGFIFASSEIYNGLANAWDYGPLGVLLKNNLKQLWWKKFITTQKNMYGLDSMILLNPLVWQASGHLQNFSDPLIDCRNCKSRFRADKLIESVDSNVVISESSSNEEIQNYLNKLNIVCPNCQKFDWTDIRYFNLMFKTHQGVVENSTTELYLRPETAQGIFINFKNIQRTTRQKIPFGVGQIGKAFRNEITPGNFIFRTREFEQMEIEFFIEEKEYNFWFEEFLKKIRSFLENDCNIDSELISMHEHDKSQLSHYSKRTVDFNFNFPHGISELWGLAYRTNFDLQNHSNFSKKDLSYLDPITNEKFIPHIIEPSVGVERLLYAICCSCYEEQKLDGDDSRVVMHLPYKLSPYKVAILPLVNKLKDKAEQVWQELLDHEISCTFDSSGSIGKRYRRQDAIGTPYCLTIDFDSIDSDIVTIRDRDTMEQIKLHLSEVPNFFLSKK